MKYKCKVCGKEYKDERYYIQHMKNKHQIDVLKDEVILENKNTPDSDITDKKIPSLDDIYSIAKSEIIDEIIDVFSKLNGIVPKDTTTKNNIYFLWYLYSGKDYDDNIDFITVFQELKHVYQSYTK